MKKRILMVLIASLLLAPSAQAQFFKKLTKKVTDKVEESVTNNISDKAAKESDQALNKMWEMDMGSMDMNMGGGSVDPELIPDSYDFDWKYTMKMETKEGGAEFIYRFKEDSPYMGIELPKMKDMFMVIDNERDITVIYMKGMVRATKMDTEIPEEAEVDPSAGIEYEMIGSKTILGYECEGYQAETEDHVFTMYVTDEAGVGFSSVYENQKNMPQNFDPDWIGEDAMLLEMQMDDKKDPDKSVTMRCTNIEKENFSISK